MSVPTSNTQSEFCAALFDPARPAISSATNPQGEHAPKRFNVYRNNVIVSLTEAIEQGFPLCQKLVGEEFFHAIARSFVVDHPPRSPLMFEYGGELPAYIESFEPAKSVPYLADMARLEMARREAYFAADADVIPMNTFTEMGEETLLGLKLEPHPSLRVTPSRFPLFDIYQRLIQGGEIGQAAQTVLTYRKDHDIICDAAPKGFYTLTQQLKSKPLGEAVAETLEALPDADIPNSISQILQMSVSYEPSN